MIERRITYPGHYVMWQLIPAESVWCESIHAYEYQINGVKVKCSPGTREFKALIDKELMWEKLSS